MVKKSTNHSLPLNKLKRFVNYSNRYISLPVWDVSVSLQCVYLYDSIISLFCLTTESTDTCVRYPLLAQIFEYTFFVHIACHALLLSWMGAKSFFSILFKTFSAYAVIKSIISTLKRQHKDVVFSQGQGGLDIGRACHVLVTV